MSLQRPSKMLHELLLLTVIHLSIGRISSEVLSRAHFQGEQRCNLGELVVDRADAMGMCAHGSTEDT